MIIAPANRSRRGAALLLTSLIVACGQSSPAATEAPSTFPAATYDHYLWSIAIPDRLDVRPMIEDPSYIWASRRFVALNADEEAKSGVSVEVGDREVDLDLSDADAARAALQRITEGFASSSIGWSAVEPEPARSDGAWRATMTTPAAVFEWVVIAHGSQLAFISLTGIPEAERDFIIGSFAFRDPPGDPLSPPPRSPSPEQTSA